MKKIIATIIALCTLGCVLAQSEFYDIHPKFSHIPTVEEQKLLPNWYKNTKFSTPPTAPVTALAEFQPMDGVMIAYPLGIPVNLVAELSYIANVKVLVYPASDSITAQDYFAANGVNMDNIRFWVVNHDSYWTRDYGPWFIVDGNDHVGVVDFTYNRPQRPHDDVALEAIVDLMGVDRYEMPIVHTGGNYMTNGYGIAASTDLVLEENPNYTNADIQNITHQYLGLDNYMLLNDPLGEYIAHIDCWGKFLDVDKVLIGSVDPSDSRYNDFEDVANIFASTLTPWGNHYEVYRVYTPGDYYYTTPYTNSLILNDHVFVPITGSQWDNQAITAYQNAMPGYTIVPIMQSYYTPWQNTDALHCRTHELADLGMLYIKHYPITSNQIYYGDFPIQAEIKALSGEALIADSILLYYNKNNWGWESVTMQCVGESLYQGIIPNVTENMDIQYYIFAKDESGRRETHPYIGAADPHFFNVIGVGVDDYRSSEMNIYPNPCDKQCFVQSTKYNIHEILVYDVCGKMVFSGQFNSELLNLNTDNWKSGIYSVCIKDENGQVFHKKLIKR